MRLLVLNGADVRAKIRYQKRCNTMLPPMEVTIIVQPLEALADLKAKDDEGRIPAHVAGRDDTFNIGGVLRQAGFQLSLKLGSLRQLAFQSS